MAEVHPIRGAGPGPGLARPGPVVGVYAAVTGLAGAIPVPFLDGMMSELARGAAMRRVAARHGVALTAEARSLLSRGGATSRTSTTPARLLRTALASAVAPLRVAARVEDAAGTFFAAFLLERYLSRADRPARAPLEEDEARRVRAAVEAATTSAGLDVLKRLPLGVLDTLRAAFASLLRADGEERSLIERFVDTLLDGLADAPDEWRFRLGLAFDEALRELEGSEDLE